MIQLFRKFFSSKLGIVMTLAFLGLIAFAFASMDISSSGTFGGIAGGDRVAVVGDERIDSSELSMNLTNALDTARQTDPTITMEAFIAGGGLEDVLAQMIDRTALAEFARIEEEFDEGRTLGEVARELKLEVASTRPATADGRIYRSEETVPAILAPVFKVAFDMEEQEPQIAPMPDGESFMVFDVGSVTPSAAAPLAEIREQVTTAWRRDQGARAAKAAADRILARVAKGGTLAEAVAAESKPLPAVRNLDLNREQLAQQGRVPSELALFFSMAQGTTKKLEAPADAGWFVVHLDEVEAPTVAADDPIVVATLRQLSQATSNEYIEQFVGAAKREIGVERNQTAIDAVVAQITGQNAN